MDDRTTSSVLLHAIAHARAGDKGNHSNICLFAYRPEDYPILVERNGSPRAAPPPSGGTCCRALLA
jgi:hypothetical protein